MHREHMGRRTHQAHRREIVIGIVGNFGVEARIDHEVAAPSKQRIAVRRRPSGGGNAEIAASPCQILHVELLSQAVGEFLRKQAVVSFAPPAATEPTATSLFTSCSSSGSISMTRPLSRTPSRRAQRRSYGDSSSELLFVRWSR